MYCLNCIHFILWYICSDEDPRENYYFDTDDKAYKECFSYCKKCSKGGDSYNHNCDECKNEYTFIMPESDVTIIPSYERVSNSVTVEENSNTKEIKVEVNDATAVVYEDRVVFTVEPEEGYEVENIIIKDENNNKIKYQKLNENKYEFIMPDTNVVITPVYKRIENKDIVNPKTHSIFYAVIIISLALWIGLLISKIKRVN